MEVPFKDSLGFELGCTGSGLGHMICLDESNDPFKHSVLLQNHCTPICWWQSSFNKRKDHARDCDIFEIFFWELSQEKILQRM